MSLETGSFIDDFVVANPVSATDIVAYGAAHLRLIKTGVKNAFAGSGGAILCAAADVSAAANTITLTPTPPLLEYTTRMLVVWHQAVTNTGAVTMNISGLGAKAVVSVANAALASGDLVAGRAYLGEYDGTSVQLLAVTKNYVDQLAFNTALPAQPGTAVPKFLRTLSSVASWESVGVLDERAITTTDTIGTADTGNLVKITSGTFTLEFAAAATLTDQANGYVWNAGTGEVTLDPSGAETIDGLATRILAPGEVLKWYVEGSAIKTVLLKGGTRTFTSSGTFVAPETGWYLIDLIGGGGGSGAGGRGAAGAHRMGGVGGGGGARVIRAVYLTKADSITVTIAAGGTAGAAAGSDTTSGGAGGVGGTSTFGTLLSAYGGGNGRGGTPTGAGDITGGTGGGSGGAGGTTGAGGTPSSTYFGGDTAANNVGEGGGGNLTSASASGCAQYGGGAGAGMDPAAATTFTGGSSIHGPGGGGRGGGITTANTAYAGTAGGKFGSYTAGSGGAGGAAGVAGTSNAANTTGGCGDGGGAGGGHATTPGAGAAGSAPGGGAGGGGASTNGAASGAGAVGGRGECRVTKL